MKREDLDGDATFLIHGFFDEEECRRSIAFSEGTGYEDATITTVAGQVMAKAVRNNSRVMLDSTKLAEGFFERAKPFLPGRIDGWFLHGMNERFRYYRYDVGQTFRPHYDGSYWRKTGEESQLTFLVYLNDDFDGGTTDFLHEDETLRIRVAPKRGTALVFVHAQLHAGAEVTRGRKYALRTDVMYRYFPPEAEKGRAS
jgi:predicted 2-oxoglutarate/Fe(II)-dependent dioxygenase YbiX